MRGLVSVVVGSLAPLLLLLMVSAGSAAFKAVERQRVDLLGGAPAAGAVAGRCSDNSYDNRADCESASEDWTPGRKATGATGWYEIAGGAGTGLLVALGVVISFAGFRLVRRLVRQAGRG